MRLELLASNSNARILAGGQSLIPMLSMRLSRPSLLIDIAHIKDLVKLWRRTLILKLALW